MYPRHIRIARDGQRNFSQHSAVLFYYVSRERFHVYVSARQPRNLSPRARTLALCMVARCVQVRAIIVNARVCVRGDNVC